MAQRVNTRMLVLLLAVLGFFAVGVLGLAWYAQQRSPERFIARGHALAAEGDLQGAAKAFGFAVGKEPGNLEYLDLWFDTLSQVVAPNEIVARENFATLTNIIRQRAQMHSHRADLHVDWLEYLRKLGEATNAVSDYQTMLEAAEFMLDSIALDDPAVVQGRRYRGIATAGLMSAGTIEDEAQRTRAREDLEAALAADGGDTAALAGLVRWHLSDAEQARRRNAPDDRRRALEAAIAAADTFIVGNPETIQGRLIRFSLQRTLATAFARPGDAVATVSPEQSADLFEAERRWLAQSDVTVLDWIAVLDLASQVAATATPADEAMQRAVAILEHRLQGDGADVRLLMARGRFERLLGDLDTSYATFEAVLTHPDLPTGHAALLLYGLRRQAALEQFKIASSQWAQVTPSDRDAWNAARERAVVARARYADLSLETDPTLLYMDGRLALGDGDTERAAQLLERARENTGGDSIDVLLASAEALLRLDQTGPAYARLEEADALSEGRRFSVILQMAEIDLLQNRLDAALRNAQRALALQPDSERATRIVDRVSVARGEARLMPTEPGIPFVQEAMRRYRASGRHEDALSELETGLASHPESHLLLREAAIIAASAGRNEQALQYADRALAVAPRDRTIQILRARIAGGDITPIVAGIAEEEAQRVPDPAAAILTQAEVFARYELRDEAQRLIDEAASKYPTHRRVVSIEFDAALRNDDFAEAERLAQVATDNNLDDVNGRTYRGRVLLARENTADGIATLRSAAEVKPWDNQLWRWLAQGHEQNGDLASARQAYERSLENKPDDPDTLRLLAELEARQGDVDAALARIREATQLAPNNPAVERAFLELEGRYGNRDRIIAYRRSALERGRGGVDNIIKLAELLLAEGRVDETDALLAQAAPETPEELLRVAVGRAEVDAARGGVETGVRHFTALVDANAGDPGFLTAILLEQGEFLMRHGDAAGGMAAYRVAQRYQDAKTRPADRRLGEYFFARGDFARALEHWIPASEAAPEDEALSLRIIQTSVLLANAYANSSVLPSPTEAGPAETGAGTPNEAQVAGLIERARARLRGHLQRFGESLETNLFSATIAVFEDDWEQAAVLYSRAVQNHPNERQVYIARARFNIARYVQGLGNPNAVRAELERDLAFLRERDSQDTEPLILEAQLAAARRDPQTGQPAPDIEGVIARYYDILAIQPRNERIRSELIRVHVDRREFDRAGALVREAQRLEPQNPLWFESAAAIQQAQGGRSDQVIKQLDAAFAADPTPARLELLVRTILSTPTPGTLTTTAVTEWRAQLGAQALLKLNSQADLVARTPALRMLEAQSVSMTGDREQGQRILEQVYREDVITMPGGADRDRTYAVWLEAAANTVLLRNLPVFIDRVVGPWSAAPASFAAQSAVLYNALLPRALSAEVASILRGASVAAAEAAVAGLEASLAAVRAESSEPNDAVARLESDLAEAKQILLDAYLGDQQWDAALALVEGALASLPPDAAAARANVLDLRARVRRSRGESPGNYLPDLQAAYAGAPTPERLSFWVQMVLDAVEVPSTGDGSSTDAALAVGEARRFAGEALAAVEAAVTSGLIVEDPMVELTRIRLLDAAGRTEEARQRLASVYPASLSTQAASDPARQQQWDQTLVAWYAAAGGVVAPLEMRAFFDRVPRSDPDSPRERWVLGRYLLSEAQRTADPDQARQVLAASTVALEEAWGLLVARAAGGTPEVSDVLAYSAPIGTALVLAERWEDAVEVWERMIEADPKHLESLNNLAFVLADRLDRAEDALQYAERAYAERPDAPSIADTYGYVLLRNQRLAEAEAVLKPLIGPASPPEHRKHYGETLLALGRADEARSMLLEARADAERLGRLRLVDEIDQLIAETAVADAEGPAGPEN